jgi:hypothetical protein
MTVIGMIMMMMTTTTKTTTTKMTMTTTTTMMMMMMMMMTPSYLNTLAYSLQSPTFPLLTKKFHVLWNPKVHDRFHKSLL